MKPTPPLSAGIVPLVVGLVAVANVLKKPFFAMVPAIDVLLLVGGGMCFGAALLLLINSFRSLRSS
jgi:hypothetical protein